ncbi:NAD-dependent epimerase/dehydratase family protein [Roseobacter sp. HKCCD7870]|uniref:NAD-dependent epimerase/dehydratase family protein n=1 Tax=Roseobacter sp. HKCCD7870 TaxID=3120343 RepID=UPI0030EEA9CD
MRVLVTGAGGYLGRSVITGLVERGYHVIACSRSGALVAPASQAMALDVTDRIQVRRVLQALRPDVILHLAGFIPSRIETFEDMKQSELVNLYGTQILSEEAAKLELKKFIFASSIAVYGDAPLNGAAFLESDDLEPRGAYGRHKAAAEAAVSSSLSDRCVMIALRFAGLHGPPRKSGVIFRYCEAAKLGKPLSVLEPDSVFNFLWVADAAKACLASIEAPLSCGAHVFNIAGGTPIALNEVAKRILAITHSRSSIVLGTGTTRRQVMDISAARKDLRFTPANLSQLLGVLCDER